MIIYTVGFAFIAVLLCMGLLGIGWLLTGKPKIQAGACGRAPSQKRSESCGQKASCQLCEHEAKQTKPGCPSQSKNPQGEAADDNTVR